MDKTVLYRNSRNGISRWTIWHEGNVIYMKSEAKIGDSPSIFTEHVPEGKAGRSLQQQIDLRMKARVRGKVDNGYVHTYKEAQSPILKNVMGFLQPMLAQKFQDVKKFQVENYFAQPKLDGHRCLITRQGSELIAYSRRGREIHTIDHILKHIDIPDGVTLDGELYVHGEALQTIASWAKRKQPHSEKLKFVVYDILEDVSYEERLRILTNDLNLSFIENTSPIFHLHTIDMAQFPEGLRNFFTYFRNKGYEGMILRERNTPYEVGRRSKGLIKVKETHDAEYQVVDVSSSKDDWGILHCKLPNGHVFRVSAPGTVADKTKVLKEKEKFIGRLVTVEYAHLTKEGVPFHPVATRWRNDL